MLAGDFTAFASPACNGGRQIALRAPFVNNRIDPALFSPAAVNIAKRLPTTTDPVRRDQVLARRSDNDEGQVVARVDYQLSANHSVFGRYMRHVRRQAARPGRESGNVLTTGQR